MDFQQIHHWLDATEFILDDDEDRKAKRRRLNPPVTPPSSDTRPNNEMDSPPRGDNPSRWPFDGHIPWIKRLQTSLSGRSRHSVSSVSDKPLSQRSTRTPSPQKQLRKLQLNPRGLDVRCLSGVAGSRPLALQTLLEHIETFAIDQGIVARDMEEELTKAAASDARFKWALRAGAPHVSDDEGLAGRTPSPGAVRKVMKAARECDEKHHPEANWNLEVHQRILDMAFRPAEEGETETSNLIDFMGCSTASIIGYYGTPTLSKKVDFCVYIEPKQDTSATFEAGATYARMAMPQEIVNFTEFAPLYDRFIALSIETKKPSENFEAAQLQLGVWGMAHWEFLRRLAELHAKVTGNKAGTPVTTGTAGKIPEFLPGIIAQGHNWSLVITTMEGDRTVLWHKVAIGSTEQPRGIYQLVRSLQYLEKWAKEVHWPWLKATVEGIAAGLEDVTDL
ncbi:hypothetical protein ISF_09761 [Cordyceps fumosorosea ARSEF 2679]|uniref:PD-(D/E)XK nuclease-like domain-containing protein n=1 Tax=Cordyceps fumosorosea (strain ARSEF 2679) TaxID=1081104 RepID=A0A162JGS1_CORFA|nr:hypothetical protein ISF_09761 [Cordyceps fumosorosea ARSEF 2679]OAA41833.1 hypothetical protein ISF_09761 [Cordyceps fumosorosea ARSEF 2679]